MTSLQLLGNVDDGTLPGKMKNLENVVRTTVQPLSWQGCQHGHQRVRIAAGDYRNGRSARRSRTTAQDAGARRRRDDQTIDTARVDRVSVSRLTVRAFQIG
jgi:hypothetical protein